MIIPIKLEVESYKFPVSNYIIIIVTSFFFFFTLSESNYYLFESMVLTDFNPKGLLGNMFLHADIIHLAETCFSCSCSEVLFVLCLEI